MKYASLDIRIGVSGVRQVSAKRAKFHDQVAGLLLKEGEVITRVGSQLTSPIDHKRYVHHSAYIKQVVADTLSVATDSEGPLNLCIIDFTSNAFVSVRDPLLFALADGIKESCENGLCTFFAILLSELPGPSSASFQLFDKMKELLQAEFTVLFVPDSGDYYGFFSERREMPKFPEEYRNILRIMYGDPSSKLERKCIRRLGHFQSHDPKNGTSRCRIYSYYMLDCENELSSLFADWWREHGNECKSILFDLKNNISFRNVLKAFGSQHNILTERIVDVLQSVDLRKAVMQIGKSLLVLDAFETGSTLNHYILNLRAAGIEVSNEVVVCINKSGSKISRCGDSHVFGFVSRSGESEITPCLQCNLKLPFLPESHESFIRIRAFDMFHMISSSGWEQEPVEEAPENRDLRYDILPAFSKILEDFGDWIGLKIFSLLHDNPLPDDFFVIHPEEADSTALSNRLLSLFDRKLYIVKIPKYAIKEAQCNGNSWNQVVSKYQKSEWVERLSSVGDAGAIILDIFKGSGSTLISLIPLLQHFGKAPFCYVCLVDFDPRQEQSGGIAIPKYSLYNWYNPRVLLPM
jgi:hypothetical protein